MNSVDSNRGQADCRATHERARIITQCMLTECQQLKPHAKRYNDLRKLICQLLDEDVDVEIGPLDAAIQPYEQQRLTIGTLTDLLGEKAAQELKDRVEPTVCRTLIIFQRQADATPRTADRGAYRGSI